jgi:DNA ligase-1
VRSVTPSLLLEVAFEAVDAAPRRKAGLTLRAPRLLSICWEADADQAVRLESLRPV